MPSQHEFVEGISVYHDLFLLIRPCSAVEKLSRVGVKTSKRQGVNARVKIWGVKIWGVKRMYIPGQDLHKWTLVCYNGVR